METGQPGGLGEHAKLIAESQELGLALILHQQMEEQTALGLLLIIMGVMEVLVVSCPCILYYLLLPQPRAMQSNAVVVLLSGQNILYLCSIVAI